MRIIIRLVLSLLAVLILAAAGFGIAFWAPDVPVDALKARWAPPPSTFIAIEGMQVHLRDEGPRDDPTPIVLIHGTSASLHTWDGWTQTLSKQHRVIRFDLPGFGLTGPAPDDDYSVTRYARFVVDVLDQLHVNHAVLGGNSLGGEIAWATAALYPTRVERLILVDAGGYAFVPTSVPLAFQIARMPGADVLIDNILPRKMIEDSIKNVYGNPALVTPALVDRYYDLALRAGNRHALVKRFKQLNPGEMADRIPGLHLPTLIIWGGRDHLIPIDSAQHFKRDIAGSQLQVFDELGHVPHEEDPQRTVDAVVKFLAVQ
jgi:pimeloyl-ACP methyl ester carboxylesterase